MSKPNAISALLGSLVLCLPAVAATTISGDEILIRLRGIEQDAPGHYTVACGTLALLEVQAMGGAEVLLVYAAPVDQTGQPDLGSAVVLFVGQPAANGSWVKFFSIPNALAGMTFKLQAIAYDPINLFRASEELTIGVTNAQVLHAPAMSPRLGRADPVLVN
jgi:hypothetical protein